MLKFQKILCPVNFDQNSTIALRAACDIARERKGILYVLHVVALPPGPEVALSFGKMETAARRRLERLTRDNAKGVNYEILVKSGSPDIEVLDAAERLGVSLIVMATHGRKGLRHLVLGSVAESVVRGAPCPVLTIRPGAMRVKPSAARRRKPRGG